MASQIKNYKCPACMGPLHFDSESGKMKCDYCGSSYEIAEIEALYKAEKEKTAEAQGKEQQEPDGEQENAQGKEQQEPADEQENAAEDAAQSEDAEEWDFDAAGGDWGAAAEGMKTYSCPSCGAELICEKTTAATSCPYCGSPTIIEGQFEGSKCPDFVLPFKVDKEAAIAALKNHYKGKVLLPKAFTDENHIEEIKGVYVPFWLFDATAEADLRAHCTNSTSYKEGNYLVTDTSHFKVEREGTIAFERISVDGSEKMPDDYMDSIEPFDYSELKPFLTAYLSGYLADKYDVAAEESARRADERCRESAIESLEKTIVGYGSVGIEQSHVRLHRSGVKYALMPVWLLSTKWRDKTYLFAMNGQTGKMVGDLPMDKAKSRRIFWSIAAGLSVALSLLLSGPIAWFLS